ncbi:1-acyl-sn-glycerol-3-phosphate acyltransferase [Mucinivorans hirudinis]|uniref:1-acyl-sn-glycerol-3-phosphate acyltransferase n=1 Tax=Mucinivorans hirudinis TaxID=1433126 RepID=A0A060R7G7_9BACT|nr:1-acyl-sn-glycerol-3-phosphate acyltransferase [Mucinivorans hirudinis]
MKSIYYLTTFILFSIVLFLAFSVAWLFAYPFDRHRIVSHEISRFWSKWIYRLNPWWRVRVSGMENIEKGKSYIVVSNHQAMLDIPLLYVLPFNFKWVSKEEVFHIPIFGWVLAMHDDIAIKRGGSAGAKKMLDKSNRMLKNGVSVIIFPEGTRTKTGKIGRFHQGAFLLARKSKADILPVMIDGTFDAIKDWKVKTPHSFTVKIMEAVPYDPELTIEEISNLMQQKIGAAFEQLHR